MMVPWVGVLAAGLAGAADNRCGAYGSPALLAEFPALAVSESSGLAVSSSRVGVLYTHDDSGGAAVVHAITTLGDVLGGHPLPKGWNNDWEALEAGPCPASGSLDPTASCLYVGDLGDNRAKRPRVVVRVVEEPAASAEVGTPLSLVDSWKLRYPDGPQDAEALLVHPRSGAVDVLTKRLDGQSRIYRVPANSVPQQEQVLEALGSLSVTSWADDPLVTGAAWSPSGDTVVVRTYTSLGVWTVDPCTPDGWWTRPPDQVLAAPRSRQGEAVAVGPDGQIFTTSEGHPMPLFVQACLEPGPPRACREAQETAPRALELPPEATLVPAPDSDPSLPSSAACAAVGTAARPAWLSTLFAVVCLAVMRRRRCHLPETGLPGDAPGPRPAV